jgi:hypothetical protein
MDSCRSKTDPAKPRLRRRTGRHIPERIWRSILASIPVACVDVIGYRRVKRRISVLLGYRKIYPYRNRWALPGGRIIKKNHFATLQTASWKRSAYAQLTTIAWLVPTLSTSSTGPTSASASAHVYPRHRNRRQLGNCHGMCGRRSTISRPVWVRTTGQC